MEDPVEETGTVSTSAKFKEVSALLETNSRFFMGRERSDVQSLTDVLEGLSDFLGRADANSVEKLTKESMKRWFERAKEDVKAVDDNCLLRLSKALQDQRVINFLSEAGQWLGNLSEVRKAPIVLKENGRTKVEEKETAGEFCNRSPVYYSVQKYVDSEAKVVTAWLTGGGSARSVLSLFGPAGIGKTTLAKRVYKSKTVRDHFECCHWIDVSGVYKIEDLRTIVVDQIPPAKSFLEKRYVFVFDGVSNEDFWGFVKHGLPENGRGSRVIITTASDRVVDASKESIPDHVHKLGPLSGARSFELFCGIAFCGEPEPRCPAELEALSREIVRLCNGFPFPIMGVAGLLSKKEKLVSEWQKVHNGLKLEVENKIAATVPCVLQALADLSFNDLPNYLRPCFLFFSVFPEGSIIPNDKLFKLWIAEGFIAMGKTRKPQDELAGEYLTELMRRDLVQPCQGFHGLDRFCQVDRWTHGIARRKAEELDFCSVWDGKSSRSSRRNCRRVSVCNVAGVLDTIGGYRTRSVFLSNVRALPMSFLTTLIAKNEFLTLLDFEDCPIKHLPEEVGNLFNLKYLGLKNTLLIRLPKSLGNLQSLETLNLTNTLVRDLPVVEINCLENLRHLVATVKKIGGDSTKGVRIIKKGIEGLANLRTLMNVEVGRNGLVVLEEIAKLRQLRRLGISGLTSAFMTALFACIYKLIHLESLTLEANDDGDGDGNEILHFQGISSPLLRRLILKGRLPSLPNGIDRLRNLSIFCLSHSRLERDPLRVLSILPNLSSLWLHRAYEGEKLHFEEGGFKRLKLLVVKGMDGLRALEIDHGALPVLEELRIGRIPCLNEAPAGIFHLRNLKVLSSYDMGREFVLGMNPDEGLDHWKVEHVKSVLFWYRIRGRSSKYYKMFKLGDPYLIEHVRGLAMNSDVFEPKQCDLESSFCESDPEEEEEDDQEDDDGDGDDVGELKSFSRTQSTISQKTAGQGSFSSGFYTDDVEE